MAVACLVVSAVLVAAGSAAYHAEAWSGSSEAQPHHWKGAEMGMQLGSGTAEDGGLRIDELASNGKAVAYLSGLDVQAERFSYLHLRWSGMDAALTPVFFWRLDGDPRQTHSTRILWPGTGRAVVPLMADPQWRGTVTDLGVLLIGELREPLTIGELSLRPPSLTAFTGAIATQWLGFEGWHQYSINSTLVGEIPDPLVPMVPAIALWVGLALLLYLAGARLTHLRPTWTIALTIVFVGWLALDMRWQWNHWRQLEETQDRFAGKSWEEKRLAARDGELFAFIQDVKARLPEASQRIFVVAGDIRGDDEFVVQRAEYHLRPHNVGSGFVTVPRLRYARSGDYIIALGEPKGLVFNQQEQVLELQGNRRIKAGKVYQRAVEGFFSLGTVYRVR